MWLESSSLSTVNLAKKLITIPEISNFFLGDYFYLARPVLLQLEPDKGYRRPTTL